MDIYQRLATTTIGEDEVMLTKKPGNMGFYISIYRDTNEYIHTVDAEDAKRIYAGKVRELLNTVA